MLPNRDTLAALLLLVSSLTSSLPVEALVLGADTVAVDSVITGLAVGPVSLQSPLMRRRLKKGRSAEGFNSWLLFIGCCGGVFITSPSSSESGDFLSLTNLK